MKPTAFDQTYNIKDSDYLKDLEYPPTSIIPQGQRRRFLYSLEVPKNTQVTFTFKDFISPEPRTIYTAGNTAVTWDSIPEFKSITIEKMSPSLEQGNDVQPPGTAEGAGEDVTPQEPLEGDVPPQSTPPPVAAEGAGEDVTPKKPPELPPPPPVAAEGAAEGAGATEGAGAAEGAGVGAGTTGDNNEPSNDEPPFNTTLFIIILVSVLLVLGIGIFIFIKQDNN